MRTAVVRGGVWTVVAVAGVSMAVAIVATYLVRSLSTRLRDGLYWQQYAYAATIAAAVQGDLGRRGSLPTFSVGSIFYTKLLTGSYYILTGGRCKLDSDNCCKSRRFPLETHGITHSC